MPRKMNRPKKCMPGIWQIGPDRFLVRVWLTERTGRRRKVERMAETLGQAVDLRDRLRAGGAPPGRPIRGRFDAYAESWLASHAAHLAPSTREKYVAGLARLVEAFGGWYVDALSPGDVRAWQARAAGEFAPATVNDWLRTLRLALDAAVVDEVLVSNPARVVKALPERCTTGRRGTALSLEEFRRFLGATERLSGEGKLSGDMGRLVVVLAWTGLRIGEALALKWADVVEGEVRVGRSIWRGLVKSTKTGESRRVSLVEPVKRALEEQRSWLVVEQHPALSTGLVFPADRGHALAGARRRGGELRWYRAPSCLQKPLRKIAVAARAPEVSPHSLRRTFEDLTRLAGVDKMVRQSLAGWRSDRVQAVYAGVSKAERDAAGAAVVRLVREGGR